MKKNRIFSGAAHAKLILTGDHSVVYGRPAVTMSLPLQISVRVGEYADSEVNTAQYQTLSKDASNPVVASVVSVLLETEMGLSSELVKKLKNNTIWYSVRSQIPQNSGLGSSSALAAALIQAVFSMSGKQLDAERCADRVWQVERRRYQTASPIDAVTVCEPGLWYFSHADAPKSTFHGKKTKKMGAFTAVQAVTKKTDAAIAIRLIDSGAASESTAEMVGAVREFLDGLPSPAKEQLLDQLGVVSNKIAQHFFDSQKSSQDIRLLQLIHENQQLLSKLPVVSPGADKIIREVERLGGAAKITAAGGLKHGSGWLIVAHQEAAVLDAFIAENDFNSLVVSLDF